GLARLTLAALRITLLCEHDIAVRGGDDLRGLAFAVAQEHDLLRLGNRAGCDLQAERRTVLNLFARETNDDVTLFDPGLLSGAAGVHAVDEDALQVLIEPKLAREHWRHRLERNADTRVVDLAVLDQHVRDRRRQVHRDREADTVVAGAAGHDGRVDPD